MLSTLRASLLLAFCLVALAPPGLCQTGREAPEQRGAAPSIGVVLSGGGSFGAFEAGALQAYFDRWRQAHNDAPPPLTVIAGASTGALIGTFAALGPEGVAEASEIYQNVATGNILRPKASVLLPFFLFSKWSSSAYSVGPLARTLASNLPNDKLSRIGRMWPGKRLVVLATNFGTGQPAPFTNAPDEMGQDLARFREGILASTISPLATPPVYLKADPGVVAQPHLDGGIHAVAPFQALFDLAARSPQIDLTQVVVFSAYPIFPGNDAGQVQATPFGTHPEFGDIGARMDALISESSITKEVGLAWAAIELRRSGVSAEKVRERTGLNIPTPPGELILIAPETRLGWNNLKFDEHEMREMYRRGMNAPPRVLIP
jgi:predicted acylesterase/phospholipase RssA